MQSPQGISKVEALEAVEDIRQCKARYFRCMDQKDWDGFQDTMDPSIDFNVSGALYAINKDTGEVMPSGDVIIVPSEIDQSQWQIDPSNSPGGNAALKVRTWEQQTLFGAPTMHQGHMAEVTILTPTTAKAIFALTHHLRFPTANQFTFLPFAPKQVPQMELFGYGFYDEQYVRGMDGKWRIKHLRFSSTRVNISYAR